jgi:D-glycero-beta-D-manno-heptose-7-phosphate kinase
VSDLLDVLKRFKDRRVVVLGDFVADVFMYGEISRISREAPVLILNHRETQLVPGGGANAVHNLRALGAQPVPVGVVGDDDEGRQLLEYFKKLGIDTRAIRIAKNYRTPAKMRILGGAVHSKRQQIVRIDSGGAGDRDKRPELTSVLDRLLRSAQALLVSDYGYGAVTPELAAKASQYGVPATVDSRFALGSFAGMKAATPNESEIEALLGITIGPDLEKLEWAGRKVLRKLDLAALLITRGKDGMALFEPRKKTLHIPIYGSSEIVDVTGAGDTVIATFTLALASGASYEQAARLSNYAGGVVVMKHGTKPITYNELFEAIAGDVA